jgi:hypothetical protein
MLQLTKILLPVDFSEPQAATYGVALSLDAFLVNGEGRVVDPKEALQGDESQDVSKAVLPEDGDNLTIARQV